MSDAYQNFVDGYLNATSWPERKDGPPTELLDALNEEERDKAGEQLITRLSSWRDDWPIIGLGHLRSTASLHHLKSLLRRAVGSSKAYIATSIWKIDGDDEMIDIVIRCSRRSLLSRLNPFYPFSQIDIIYCLAEFDSPKALSRLEELQFDRDCLVSYNATRAVSLKSGLHKVDQPEQPKLSDI